MINFVRVVALGALLSGMGWVVLILDWLETDASPWRTEGPTTCIVLSVFPAVFVLIMLVALALRRAVWLADRAGLPMPHAWLLAEAEARGEAPA